MFTSTPPTEPTQYVTAQQPTTPTINPPTQWKRLAFTILPFIVYLIALHIPLPTYHVTEAKGMRDWSDSDNIVAVGIMPWIMAAVMVEMAIFVFPGARGLRQNKTTGGAEFRRVTNIFGLVFAVLHALWITWDLTNLHIGIFDPSDAASMWKPYVSSPILAFVTLLTGAIGFKLFVDFIGPRSFLGTHGRSLAVALLLSTIYTIASDNSPFDSMDIRIVDLVRIGVNLLKCGVLISFILIKPHFLPQRTITA